MVGSHVPLTTRQLDRLDEVGGIVRLELDATELIAHDPAAAIDSVVDAAVGALASSDVMVGTSRTVLTGGDAERSLAISRRISAALVEAVRRIDERATPRYVIAKGGITSSDVATDVLGIRRAFTPGTLLPGIVSAWAPVGGPFERRLYVVFPGNVGDDGSLAEVVTGLRGEPSPSIA